MRLTTQQLTSTLALAGLALLTADANAAAINWAAAVDNNGGADVSTNGASVVAVNAQGANVTINGVAFTGVGATATGTTSGVFSTKLGDGGGAGTFDPNGTPTAGAGNGPYDAFSADYKNLVSSGYFLGGNAAATPLDDTVTFSGLTAGTVYEIQLFVYDGRNGRSGFYMELDGSSSNTVFLNTDPKDGVDENGADGVGQSIIGTFTADATTQSFDTAGYLGTGAVSDGRVQINAIQLRDLGPVPEPGSLALLGLGGLLIARRRRG
ncbi:MAG: PEP-CTERM sorting domain-containing protein [Phycisphaeraceae bacterium]|nr:PEP-CTERM sorting domain-containing protein [Phycisphaeraceae bacterium]